MMMRYRFISIREDCHRLSSRDIRGKRIPLDPLFHRIRKLRDWEAFNVLVCELSLPHGVIVFPHKVVKTIPNVSRCQRRCLCFVNKPVAKNFDQLGRLSQVSFDVRIRNVRNRLLKSVSFLLQNENPLFGKCCSTKRARSKIQTQLKRHVEAKHLSCRVCLASGEVVNPKARFGNQSDDFFNSNLPGIRSLQRVARPQSQGQDCKDQWAEQRHVIVVKWAIDEDAVVEWRR